MPDSKHSIRAPPHSELTDFDTFASAMTTAPLDDLHKYLDSDDEQDLEDNYDGEDDKENGNEGEDEDDSTGPSYTGHSLNTCLEDADSDNSDHGLDHDASTKGYEYFDPRLDIDRSKLRPSHAASRHLDPYLQKTIDKTELLLEQLSIQAQSVVEEQPMSTQIVLVNQAVEHVFKPYGVHGSQAQFSASVMKFLSGGETVRRPGREGRDGSKDGKLRFVDVEAGTVHGEGYGGNRGKLKRKAGGKEKLVTDPDRAGRTSAKVPRVQGGDDVVAVKKRLHKDKDTASKETARRADDPHVSGEREGYGFQPTSTVPLEEPLASVDSLSFRKISGPLDMDTAENNHQPTSTSTACEPNIYLDDLETIKLRPRASSPQAEQSTKQHNSDTLTPHPQSHKSLFTPLAATFSQSLRLQTKTPSTWSLASPNPQPHPHFSHDPSPTAYSCTHEPIRNAALARELYNPISLRLSWPATTRSSGRPSMPTPGLLDSLNNIVHLTNAEARFTLSYYVRKYEAPTHLSLHPRSGSSETDAETEPPHALFRLGIAQHLMSQVGKAVDNKESDDLGLNPEARRVLGEVWEEHPGTQAWGEGGLLSGSGREGGEDGWEAARAGDVSWDEGSGSDVAMSEGGDRSSVASGPSTPYRNGRGLRGSTTGAAGLNPLEKALLARACNVSVETVDTYWDDMRWKTRGWGAMRAWCAAQDKIRIARVKAEGRW